MKKHVGLTVSLLVLALSIAACSSKKPAPSAAAAAPKKDAGALSQNAVGTSETDEYGVTTTIVDDNYFQASAYDEVAIIHSKLVDLGVIRFIGDDAQNLYEALAVKTRMYPANAELLPTRARIGKNLECYLETRRSNQEVSYQCNLYFDPKTGEAKMRDADAKAIAKRSPVRTYNGHMVWLVSGSTRGTIVVTREEANMIHAAMEGRRGVDVVCSEDTELSLSRCVVSLNVRTGSVL